MGPSDLIKELSWLLPPYPQGEGWARARSLGRKIVGCSPHLWVGATKHGHLQGPGENPPPSHPSVGLRPAGPGVGVGDSGTRGHRRAWSQPGRGQAGLCEVDFHSNQRESVGAGLALGGKDHQVQGLGRASGCPSVARPALVWSHGRHRSPTWTEGRRDSGSTARHRGNLNQPQGELRGL